jgi:ribosome maturation factor RimP
LCPLLFCKMIEERIEKEIEKILQELDFSSLFLVNMELKGIEGESGKLKIFIDGLKGVSIQQCARISRSLGQWLEDQEIFRGKYNLEVSSPGVDEPLKDPRQFPKHIGRKMNLELSNGVELNGILEATEANQVLVKTINEKQEVRFEDIVKAQVLISF